METFKVLILDDEQLIANGLAQKVNWRALGCTVAGVGYDGSEGLRLLEEKKPDILLTDIIMPGCTGLELAQHIQQRNLPVKVVLLTAYDDFAYARRAIGFGVKDYILKPIDKQEIAKIVRCIVKELRDSTQIRREHEKAQRIAEHMLPLLSQAVLFDNAIHGYAAGELAETYSSLFDEAYNRGIIAVLQMTLRNTPMEDLAAFSVYSLTKEYLAEKDFKCLIKQIGNRVILIFAAVSGLDQVVLFDRVSACLKGMLEHIQTEKQVRCCIGLAEPYQNLDAMHGVYLHACSLLKQGFFDQDSTLHTKTAAIQESRKAEVGQVMTQLLAAEQMGNPEEVQRLIQEYSNLLTAVDDADFALENLQELAGRVNRLLEEYGELESEVIDRSALDISGVFSSCVETIQEKMMDVCLYIRSKQRITSKIILLVENRYAEPDFSLQLVADELSLNQSYLSRLFKKERGINFSQFLTDYRIDKACELLRVTDYRGNEIAAKTGFSDERYFSTVFKKKCGIAPKKYRETMRKSEL